MKVGVLGSGDVGQVLGAGFISRGHEVKLGTREPGKDKVKAWVAKNGAKASAGTFEETAKFGELLVLSTLWDGTKSAIQLAKPENFAGKVVIDTTNPLDFSKGAPPKLSVGWNNSAGEEVQRLLPKARVVSASTWSAMRTWSIPSSPADRPICSSREMMRRRRRRSARSARRSAGRARSTGAESNRRVTWSPSRWSGFWNISERVAPTTPSRC